MNLRLPLVLCVLAAATAARADDLSTSVMRPTALDPARGQIAGSLPGGQGATSWYVALDLEPGELMVQLQVSGSANSKKRLDLELLDPAARVAQSTYVMADLDPKAETTKVLPVDKAGRAVIRLLAEGKETGRFCVLIGGTARPATVGGDCPAAPAAAPVVAPAPAPALERPQVVVVPRPVPTAPAPTTRPVEVVVSRCEERLRVGSDFLFDFDRAEVRPEAEPALAHIADRIAAARKPVVVEGHTDAVGTESYNQRLSERRAAAVRTALLEHGLDSVVLYTRGFGKSRPVAPNQHPDGSDDPDGRQRNRRVEVVVNTCS